MTRFVRLAGTLLAAWKCLGHGDKGNLWNAGGPMAYRKELPASLALASEAQAEVTALIEPAGLDASEFMWVVHPSESCLLGILVSALIHTPTGYSFRFEFLESSLGQNRVSVFTSESRPNGRRAAASWEDQLGHVREWLMCLADAKQ